MQVCSDFLTLLAAESSGEGWTARVLVSGLLFSLPLDIIEATF